MSWLNSLKDIFSQSDEVLEKISPETAIAVLLIEMMKVDGNLDASEESFLLERLAHHFSFDAEKIAILANDAHKKLKESIDYYQFTHVINKQLKLNEKLELLKSLWMMAAIDGNIDAHENHFIRKISDLLHLRHSEFIRVKDEILRDNKIF